MHPLPELQRRLGKRISKSSIAARRIVLHTPVSKLHRLIAHEHGQALPEFALVLPILILLLFGMIEFGRGFNYWNDATHTSAEGARFAAVNRKPDPTNAASLQTQLRSQLDTSELRSGGSSALPTPAQVCVDFPTGTANAGDPVRVTVTFTYHWLPVLDNVTKLIASTKSFPATTTFTSSAIMRLEAAPTNFAAGCS